MSTPQHLVISLMAADRPGIVDTVAQTVTACDGCWLESSMARLAGQFAGVLLVSVPVQRQAELIAALAALEAQGIRASCADTQPPPAISATLYEIDLVGADRTGIVKQLSALLRAHGVNVERLETDRQAGSMSGAPQFFARAIVNLPADLDPNLLTRELEDLSEDLQVSLEPQ